MCIKNTYIKRHAITKNRVCQKCHIGCYITSSTCLFTARTKILSKTDGSEKPMPSQER